MAVIGTVEVRSAYLPPLVLDFDPDAPASDGAGWWLRLLKPKVSVTIPIVGTVSRAPGGEPPAEWDPLPLAGLLGLAGLGFWLLWRRGRAG